MTDIFLQPAESTERESRKRLMPRPKNQLCKHALLTTAVILAGCGGNGNDILATNIVLANASAQSRCDAFIGRKVEGATVTRAALVSGSPRVPEYCSVTAKMPKELEFEVRLPTDWNRRIVFMGGGGFDGAIRSPENYTSVSPDVSARGYATIASNHGHTGGAVDPDATWALDSQMLDDYANQSVPRVLPAAKAILRERYGDALTGTKMVYEGCSGGGRQGLIQAQRNPELFDGVISRAPANAYTPQFLWYQQVAKQLSQPGASLSQAKMQTVSDAVMARCDALDGLSDKMIGRPEACKFDPVELACTGAETDSCLTPPQVQSVKKFYAPTSVANGRYKWPGFPVGGEVPGWNQPARDALGKGYMKYMVAQDPTADWLRIDPSKYTARIDELIKSIDAVDPDLSRFKAKGGKLILWTGLTDWLITANNATGYYKEVVAKSGGQAVADQFVEYYTSPGVQHCAGGTGADKFDFLAPMFEWLEKGIKPSTSPIIATQRTVAPGAMGASRPLCQYPKYPRYVSGDPNAATSFTCALPEGLPTM